MTFMVVDTDSYDVLLGLDFLMKIGAVVDVEREQSRHVVYESTQDLPVPLLLQQPSPAHNSLIPVLLQTVQVKDGDLDCKSTEKLASSSQQEMDNRWREICQPIRIDAELDDEGQQQIWGILERYDGSHQLYVVDVVSGEEQPEEVVSGEAKAAVRGELVQDDGERMMVKRRRPQYFDKRQQQDLILEAQELAEFRDHELSPTESDEEEDQEMDAKCIDI
ncbi:unnamed protein product [Sphagnum jensenii]|uniref:Uncharacterized protein n=1 Tax=Sphagnum jensenii TaxID=128206 RepID=A0ABP0V976_9BRYO